MASNEKEEDEASMTNTLMLMWCWFALMKWVGEEARSRRCRGGRGREEPQVSLLARSDVWAGGDLIGVWKYVPIVSRLPRQCVCVFSSVSPVAEFKGHMTSFH